MKKFKFYYLLGIFILRRIGETIYIKITSSVKKVPLVLKQTKQKIGSSWRHLMLRIFVFDSGNYIDKSEYEALKQKFQERERDLENSIALTRATLESTEDAILMVRKEGGILDWNKKFEELSEMPKGIVESGDEKRGFQHVLEMCEDPVALLELMKNVDRIPDFRGEIDEVKFKNGKTIERYTQPHVVGDQIVGRVWSFRDVTEQRKAEEALRLRDRAMLASTHGIVITDSTDCNIIYVNPAFEKITGYKGKEVYGKNCRFLQDDDRDQAELNNIRLAIKEKREGQAILRNYTKDGNLFWNELRVAPVPNQLGEVTHYVGIMVDITLRKQMEDQLLHQATHDNLTNLPNRILLKDRIQQAMVNARRTKTYAAVLFLDLDYFKLINDALGHVKGDLLLQKVAERLSGCIRETDTLARMGGDEFIMIIPYMNQPETIIPFAKKMLQIVAQPFTIDERQLNVTASIGISLYPDDGLDATTLVKNADIAMYRAKDLGRNNFQFYTIELSNRINERLDLETGLRQALKNDEFILYYQPLVDIKSEKIFGAEALIRWQHPTHGLLFPDKFIGVAEDSGLIVEIGEWVMKEAIKQCEKWNKNGYPLKIAVNISGRQFINSNIAQSVADALTQSKLSPKHLIAEMTESILMQNVDKSVDTIQRLKELGVTIAIDDFGTGYSSLSYLKRFTIDKLKIDKSFIKNLPEDSDNRAIVLAILAMAKQLKLQVLAEGIETIEQLNFLKEEGCNDGQGYYFGKPLPEKEFLKLL